MRVLGLDVAEAPLDIRARVGYMPESDAHIPGMNAVSFVAYCGELAGLPRVDAMQRAHEVLFYVGLGEARYRNVETYSTGLQPRGKVYELRVKTASGGVEEFLAKMRGAGLDCHATDEDVMRVFVPGDGGARALFELAAAEHVQVRHLRPSVPTLEDVFAHAVGEESLPIHD